MKVLARFDAQDPAHRHLSGTDLICAWAEEHGIDPDQTRAVEIVADGDGQVIVHQFDEDANGRHYVLPGTNEIAMREPFAVPLRNLPDWMPRQ